MKDTKSPQEPKKLSFAEQLNIAENEENRKKELGQQEFEKIKKELQVICDEMYKEFLDELYESVKNAIVEKVKKKEYITKKEKKIVTVDIETIKKKSLPKDLVASFEKRVMKYDMFCRNLSSGNKYLERYDFIKALGISFYSDDESDSYDYYYKVFGISVTNFKPIILKIGKETLSREAIELLDILCQRLRTDNIIFSGIIESGISGKLLFEDYKKSRISNCWHGFKARFTMEF